MEDFKQYTIYRLKTLGYICKDDDYVLIDFCTSKVQNHVKNFCNIDIIPNGLDEVIVDRICGEVLFSLKQTGQLDETFNLEMAVKQVQTGDTSVTFAIESGNTSEQRLEKLISSLKVYGESDLIRYRKIKW